VQMCAEPVKIVKTSWSFRSQGPSPSRVPWPYARYPTGEALLVTAIAGMSTGE
jgi:hypothetical protein